MVFDDFAISDEDDLPPLRPDQLANYGLYTGAFAAIVPFIWLVPAVASIALGLYARRLIMQCGDSRRGLRRSVCAVAVGGALIVGRTTAVFLSAIA